MLVVRHDGVVEWMIISPIPANTSIVYTAGPYETGGAHCVPSAAPLDSASRRPHMKTVLAVLSPA